MDWYRSTMMYSDFFSGFLVILNIWSVFLNTADQLTSHFHGADYRSPSWLIMARSAPMISKVNLGVQGSLAPVNFIVQPAQSWKTVLKFFTLSSYSNNFVQWVNFASSLHTHMYWVMQIPAKNLWKTTHELPSLQELTVYSKSWILNYYLFFHNLKSVATQLSLVGQFIKNVLLFQTGSINQALIHVLTVPFKRSIHYVRQDFI